MVKNFAVFTDDYLACLLLNLFGLVLVIRCYLTDSCQNT